jgi:hypothetical protein
MAKSVIKEIEHTTDSEGMGLLMREQEKESLEEC